MTRVSASLITSAAVLALAACADSNTAPHPLAAPTSVAAMKSPELNSRHIFHTKSFYAKSNASRPSRSTGIFYHGGPLIVTPNVTHVIAIYWGNGPMYTNGPVSGAGPGSTDNSLIGFFLSSLGGSPYFGINTTYYNGAGAHVVNTVSYTSFWATGTSPSQSPTDADMVALLQSGFNSGAITFDPNTVYAIFTGSGVNLGGGFGSQYCAYHTHGTVNVNGNQTVLYAAMPYNQEFPSGCTSGYASPNTDVAANSEVNTLAHEIEETTTDELGTAWYDNRGYENADKCAWTWGTINTAPGGGTYNMILSSKYFLIQRNWKNSGSGGCALS
jgi:Phosphate-induced protein 1 conserved region